MLRDLLSKTLKANFVQLFVFCGVGLESIALSLILYWHFLESASEP